MLWALLDYLPKDGEVRSVLELGCGTGNLSVLLHKAFPKARLHLVDISRESLEACRSRFDAPDRHVFDQKDFGQADFPDGSFDLVVSSIAIHHLDSDGKASVFSRIYDWLKDDGIFSFADQCAGATSHLYARHIANWKLLSMNAGSNDDEWDMWMQHMSAHDHHDTLGNQIQWLKEAGFSVVDCPWRYLLWSVIHSEK